MVNILDVVFPKRCVGCSRLGSYFCKQCLNTLKARDPLCPECDRLAIDGITHPRCLRPWGLDGLTAVFYNQGAIKKAIKKLKYRWVSDLVSCLIEIIPQTVLQNLPIDQNWVIYPIPLHQDRLRWRGFNQAEQLSKHLSIRLNVSLIDNLLIREEKRLPQADIESKENRIKNAQGLFIVTSKLKTSKLPSILLVDDVWTTGATMKEAAKVLKRNGVEKVWGFAIAR